MTYSTFQTYVTFGGRIGTTGGGVDIWQVGFHFADPDSTLVPALPTLGELEDLYDLYAAFHSSATLLASSGAVLEWAKAAPLDESGAYTSDAVEFNGTGTGGNYGLAPSASPQDSMAITLWSGQTLGRANYGRFYTPWNCLLVDPATGIVPDPSGLANLAAALIGDFNDAAAGWFGTLDAKVCNMSKVGSGTTKQVTKTRVGTVKDTQRRRRNRIAETYSIGTV